MNCKAGFGAYDDSHSFGAAPSPFEYRNIGANCVEGTDDASTREHYIIVRACQMFPNTSVETASENVNDRYGGVLRDPNARYKVYAVKGKNGRGSKRRIEDTAVGGLNEIGCLEVDRQKMEKLNKCTKFAWIASESSSDRTHISCTRCFTDENPISPDVAGDDAGDDAGRERR